VTLRARFLLAAEGPCDVAATTPGADAPSELNRPSGGALNAPGRGLPVAPSQDPNLMSVQPLAPAPALTLVHEQPQHSAAIEALLDHAFGPGRFVKSSERVREISEFAPELSFCAFEDGDLLGVVRQWRVRVGDKPMVFLGPLAVEKDQRSAGLGALLVERAWAAAKAAGEAGVLLVGDVAYFQRFGFEAAPAKGAVMPGPVDQSRVMALMFDGTDALSGPVRGR